MITRRQTTAFALAALALPFGPRNAWAAIPATLYKSPDCGCCEGYAKYLAANGFAVKEIASHDLPLMRNEHGIPEPLVGCHMTFIDKYIVEGHVPINAVRKLLKNRPDIKGISLPGMPDGSPGMTGRKKEPFVIYEIAAGEPKIFARE
jgi:hypothetical protein